ncbi:MAG: GNAT family N-acetyltransferase [Caulobacterales bacterium]|nr:GNAT family N-acetyltransferase [Caulobacterales bacterium]
MAAPAARTDAAGAPAEAGYASSAYAAALSEFGTPLALPASGGRLLRRSIPGAGAHDAMGCYPLFSCARWDGLASDLAALEGELVSATLVTDPFGAVEEEALNACFPDLRRVFKEHYVVDLDAVTLEGLSSHHRRNVRRGLREVTIEFVDDPRSGLEEWNALYATLIARHAITGFAAFSERSFRAQADVPGLVMQKAVAGGETVGMALWCRRGADAYYHLAAYNERGYELRASYALFWSAFERFRGEVERVSLGAAAGAGASGGGGGLDRFKSGWARRTLPVYLCGRVLDRARYAALSAERAPAGTGYFPAYRAGEFR